MRRGAQATPERYATRAGAERALWKMAADGQADSTQDGRFRALVLLAMFASLRWGEVSALTQADLDLKARTVTVRAAYVERSSGPLVLGPPKSRAGRRVVGTGLRDLMALMARMGHDSERAAMIYQHVARGADKDITDAIDRHDDDERGETTRTTTARPGCRACLMAH